MDELRKAFALTGRIARPKAAVSAVDGRSPLEESSSSSVSSQAPPAHILVTANTSWNLLNFRRSLLVALLDDGHQVTVLAPLDASSAILAEMGCRFIDLEMDNRGVSPLRDLGLVLRFLCIMRRERPAAVLGYTIKNNVYGAIAARLLGVPFLPNVSGLGTGFLGGRWLRLVVTCLYRLAFKLVPVVFFQNRDDLQLFVESNLILEEKTRCLPGSGVDLERFAPEGARRLSGPPTFLLVARLLWDKGIGEYVEAAKIIKKRRPEAVFQLLGSLSADNRTAIAENFVIAWQAEGLVTYLGEVDDVRPYLAMADCVVLPSYREGRPRSLIEAASMGKPIITTDVPGCRDVVEHGHTGFLCRPRDAEDLAVQMDRFLTLDAAQWVQLGRNGRLKMEKEYDEAIVIQSYRSELRTLGLGAVSEAASARVPGAAYALRLVSLPLRPVS